MKNLMVIIATVVLGVALMGLVYGFGENFNSLADSANNAIPKTVSSSAIK